VLKISDTTVFEFLWVELDPQKSPEWPSGYPSLAQDAGIRPGPNGRGVFPTESGEVTGSRQGVACAWVAFLYLCKVVIVLLLDVLHLLLSVATEPCSSFWNVAGVMWNFQDKVTKSCSFLFAVVCIPWTRLAAEFQGCSSRPLGSPPGEAHQHPWERPSWEQISHPNQAFGGCNTA
jgi:hypothetical protein